VAKNLLHDTSNSFRWPVRIKLLFAAAQALSPSAVDIIAGRTRPLGGRPGSVFSLMEQGCVNLLVPSMPTLRSTIRHVSRGGDPNEAPTTKKKGDSKETFVSRIGFLPLGLAQLRSSTSEARKALPDLPASTATSLGIMDAAHVQHGDLSIPAVFSKSYCAIIAQITAVCGQDESGVLGVLRSWSGLPSGPFAGARVLVDACADVDVSESVLERVSPGTLISMWLSSDDLPDGLEFPQPLWSATFRLAKYMRKHIRIPPELVERFLLEFTALVRLGWDATDILKVCFSEWFMYMYY